MSDWVEDRRDIEFFQLVRLLQLLDPEAEAVGGESDPADEAVRFRSSTDFGFSAGDIRSVERGEDGEPARVEVSFMGAASPDSFGSLPVPYAQEINRQVADHNPALRDFIDLFNHRVLSLFYRSWERGRLDVARERGAENPFEAILRSAMGLEGSGLSDRFPIDQRELLSRAGLLSMRPTPAIALEAAIGSLFELDVELESFLPAWFEIDPDDRTRLGRSNSTLSDEIALGSSVCLTEPRFRLTLGPMELDRFTSLLPGTEGFVALVSLVRLAVGSEFDFDVRLVLERERLPQFQIGGESVLPSRLGHTSWLGHPASDQPIEHALFHCSSADQQLPARNPTPADPQPRNGGPPQ